MDYRIRPLVTNLKFWAQQSGIKDAKSNTLSSYCLTLMVIHYLQCGTSPPVVPSLQLVHPGVFNLDSNVFELFEKNIPRFNSSENKQSLGALLYGFFKYYNEVFDFSADCGSIKCASRVSIDSCYR